MIFFLSIQSSVELPSLRRDLPQVKKMKRGQSFSLSVEAQGTDLTFYWLKDGSQLQSEDGHHHSVNSSSLIIEEASTEHSGNYQCVAENKKGSVTSSPCTVTIGGYVMINIP